jgi:hypothetical protein
MARTYSYFGMCQEPHSDPNNVIYCSKNGSCSNSLPCLRPENHGQTPPPAGHPSHRKSNSCPHPAPKRRPAHPGIPDRGRGPAADKGRREKPMGPTGTTTMLLVAFRHGLRASELVDLRVGAGGVQDGHPARPESQTGHPQQPPDPRGRAACSAAVAARAGAEVNVRVHLGAERAVQHCRVRPNGGAGREESQAGLQGSPAHAQACLRVCAGQQRARHKGAASLSWTREYPAYCALHRAIADAI